MVEAARMYASKPAHPNADVRMKGFTERATVEAARAWIDSTQPAAGRERGPAGAEIGIDRGQQRAVRQQEDTQRESEHGQPQERTSPGLMNFIQARFIEVV